MANLPFGWARELAVTSWFVSVTDQFVSAAGAAGEWWSQPSSAFAPPGSI